MRQKRYHDIHSINFCSCTFEVSRLLIFPFFLFQFETRQIEKCLDYIYKTAMQGVQSSQLCQQVYVTGGGAYKYSGTYLVYATLSYSASQEAHLLSELFIFTRTKFTQGVTKTLKRLITHTSNPRS